MIAIGFEVDTWKFPAGEIGVRVTEAHPFVQHKIIILESGSSDEILTAILTANALKTINYDFNIEVNAPYLPYSRQDRACAEGEPLSCKVITGLLCSQTSIDTVVTFDTHSKDSVPKNLKWKVSEVPLTAQFVLSRFSHLNPVIVFPDKGAREKYSVAFKGYDCTFADKVRDPNTGEITNIKVANKYLLQDRDVIVVDDICDGGRTFVELAKAIGTLPNSLSLFVSHGIFSKGMDELRQYYDEIEYFNKVNTNV